MRIVDGKLDMDNAKAKYECDTCGVYYREVMNTGYYDVFPLDKELDGSPSQGERQVAGMKLFCPHCGKLMVPQFNEEAAGDATAPDRVEVAYQCDDCGISYRESVAAGTEHTLTWYTSGIFGESSPQGGAAISQAVSAPAASPAPAGSQSAPIQSASAGKHELKAIGDLPPMALKKDENGHCECPRCGGSLEYIEGQPVRIVDGQIAFDDVLAHFHCPDCQSFFRPIAGTDFYQYSEK